METTTAANRMELKSMPLDTVAEILQFMAEHEDFRSLAVAMGEEFQLEEIRGMLRELAVELRKIWALQRQHVDRTEVEAHLSSRAKKILTCLSPREERTLLSAFGLIERS